MTDKYRLLAECGNFAIVKRNSRKYAGLLIQGDTLFSIVASLEKVLVRINQTDSLKNGDEIHDLHTVFDQLMEGLAYYDKVTDSNFLHSLVVSKEKK